MANAVTETMCVGDEPRAFVNREFYRRWREITAGTIAGGGVVGVERCPTAEFCQPSRLGRPGPSCAILVMVIMGWV